MIGGWFLEGMNQECYLVYCNQDIMVVLAAQLNEQAPIVYQAGVMLEIIILGATTKASFHEIPFQEMVNYLFILPRRLHKQDK